MSMVSTDSGLGACDPTQAIADFVQGFSIEATRPSAAEIDVLAAIVPKGTRVYLSAVPTRPMQEVLDSAIRLRAAGFNPVPHVAARMFATTMAFDGFLEQLTSRANVERLLIIAGDRNRPVGDLRSSLEVIDGGLLQRRGIREIGIAGYPEGHPRISQHDLDRALMDKITAAEATGMSVHIVTQFCFDAAAILQWIRRLRDFGLEHPVRVGLAGPTNLPALLRYARRCGVRASIEGLARQSGLARQLFAMTAPDMLVQVLAQARSARSDRRLGMVKPHFFAFGGVAASARWASAVADGRIMLGAGRGFRVEPTARMS
jgi:methylenetetrahydrofolate reductase (NADPH)